MNNFKLKPGDLFATPPSSWWARLVCRTIGAKTFHWGMFIVEDNDGWIITESLGKGVALTRFDYEKAYLYRIKGLDVTPDRLITLISHYGVYRYDWDVPFKTALWWLAKHYLGKTIPRWHDKEVNCQEWICLLSKELDCEIIGENEYPMCTNLENSPKLRYLGRDIPNKCPIGI